MCSMMVWPVGQAAAVSAVRSGNRDRVEGCWGTTGPKPVRTTNWAMDVGLCHVIPTSIGLCWREAIEEGSESNG